jgi:hypothetical protein
LRGMRVQSMDVFPCPKILSHLGHPAYKSKFSSLETPFESLLESRVPRVGDLLTLQSHASPFCLAAPYSLSSRRTWGLRDSGNRGEC